jgi:enoyl-CoA hydratase
MSPLSMAATLELVRRARADGTIRSALAQEFRFTARAVAETDFMEGVRAQLIDKDRNPRWKHASVTAVEAAEINALLAPLAPEWAIWEDIA